MGVPAALIEGPRWLAQTGSTDSGRSLTALPTIPGVKVGLRTPPVVQAYWSLIPLKIVAFPLDTRFPVKLISLLKWGKVG